MKKFLVTYNTPAALQAEMAKKMADTTPEEMAKGMEPWMTWKAKYGDQIVDLGAPLMGGNSLSTEGNWSDSNSEVTGYSLVQGESVDAVRAMFVGHPHLSWAPGCTVEIFETASM